jgi:glycerol-3-phosphate dehydrogenase
MIENAEYLRCEIEQTGRREMITKLEDFLRRRSKISLVVRHESLVESKGLREACEVLFGDAADEKWREYFETASEGA